MEQQLQTIWEAAQGMYFSLLTDNTTELSLLSETHVMSLSWLGLDQSVEKLDYNSVQDLSLLLDHADNKDMIRILGRSLGVPPQVIAHLRDFRDLFEYLRTSTYTLLPQLAQAAALLPNPQVVARIHKAVVNKWPLRPEGCVSMAPNNVHRMNPATLIVEVRGLSSLYNKSICS